MDVLVKDANNGEIVGVFDLKTGNATMSNRQYDKILHEAINKDVPVFKVKVK